jgi:REP-associated tyrosine transposase
MSDHPHIVIHDRNGTFPAFIELLHGLLARCLNAHWGHRECFWAGSVQTSAVELADADAVFDKLIYTLCNPVSAHLVARALDWPGASSLDAHLHDKTLVAPRPRWFFRKNGPMPETAELRIVRPPAFAHLTQEQWADKIRAAIAEREQKAAALRREKNIPLVGRKKIRTQSAFDSPNTQVPRRGLRPRVATKNKQLRMKILARLEAFQRAYEAARAKLPFTVRKILFPEGTYQLIRRHLALAPPATAPA